MNQSETMIFLLPSQLKSIGWRKFDKFDL